MIRKILLEISEAEEKALSHLEEFVKKEDILNLTVLPDLHIKKGYLFPTGVSFASREFLYPSAAGIRTGCGITLLSTDIDVDKISAEMIDKIFLKIKEALPDLKRSNKIINKRDMQEIMYKGMDWAVEKFGFPEEYLDVMEKNGSFFKGTDFTLKDVLRAIPANAIKGGIKKFGYISCAGHHFLEMQKIEDVNNVSIAEHLGIKKNKITFLLHTDSGAFSHRVGEFYMKKFKGNYKVRVDSKDGRNLIIAIYAVLNYCMVNRWYVTHVLKEVLSEYLGDVKLRLLSDLAHESITKDSFQGRDVWVHRSGASLALSPQKFPEDSLYRKTGQVLGIPGAMGLSSYLCTSQIGVEETWDSVNHGAGRSMTKARANSIFKDEEVYKKLKENKIRLYKMGSEDITEQASGAFKDIHRVIDLMERHALVKNVAELKPLAVLKG